MARNNKALSSDQHVHMAEPYSKHLVRLGASLSAIQTPQYRSTCLRLNRCHRVSRQETRLGRLRLACGRSTVQP